MTLPLIGITIDNVDNDLAPFSWVIACGLPDTQMTSVAEELDAPHSDGVESFRLHLAEHFCDAHSLRPKLVTGAALGLPAAVAGGPRAERILEEALAK